VQRNAEQILTLLHDVDGTNRLTCRDDESLPNVDAVGISDAIGTSDGPHTYPVAARDAVQRLAALDNVDDAILIRCR